MDTLHVIGTGCEGIDELRASLDDACVQWALLKLDMGSGAFLRQKILFLHMNGANCPAVRRGCVNEQTGEAQRLLCGVLSRFFGGDAQVSGYRRVYPRASEELLYCGRSGRPFNAMAEETVEPGATRV